MVIVIAVVSMVLALAVPNIMGVLRAMRVTQGGDMVMSLFSEAMETANAMGRSVEVRLYRSSSASGSGDEPFDSILVLEYYQPGENDPRGPSGGNPLPLASPLAVVRRPLARLPDGTVMSSSAEMSTLTTSAALDPATAGGGGAGGGAGGGIQVMMRQGTTLSRYSNLPEEGYKSFTMLPGGTSLSASPGLKWFVSVIESSEATRPAAAVRNFYTIQVDPVTGRLSVYRPG
jgi:type II secretory pathway pseudopilin PulG